jgi:serine phosphatase RsbU (regulator of sigma subunit)
VTYAIAVGDVSDKGMPAALMMAVSVASIRSLIDRALAPGQFLTQMNDAIADYTRTSRQNCALVYVELRQSDTALHRASDGADRTAFHLRVANAGCIAPLIKRADGSVTWVEVGGIPLGASIDMHGSYEEMALDIAPGDMVILTSDGVVETTNNQREMFGFERLEQVIAVGPQTSATAMLDHLQAALSSFADSADLHDDVTIAIIRA